MSNVVSSCVRLVSEKLATPVLANGCPNTSSVAIPWMWSKGSRIDCLPFDQLTERVDLVVYGCVTSPVQTGSSKSWRCMIGFNTRTPCAIGVAPEDPPILISIVRPRCLATQRALLLFFPPAEPTAAEPALRPGNTSAEVDGDVLRRMVESPDLPNLGPAEGESSARVHFCVFRENPKGQDRMMIWTLRSWMFMELCINLWRFRLFFCVWGIPPCISFPKVLFSR